MSGTAPPLSDEDATPVVGLLQVRPARRTLWRRILDALRAARYAWRWGWW